MQNWLQIIEQISEEILNEGVAVHDAMHLAAFAVACAEAYDAAPSYDPSAKIYWDALNKSNNDVLIKRIKGDGIQVIYTEEDPYDDPDVKMSIRKMLWDMTKNNRLKIYTGYSDSHPVFSQKDNIVFRTVHDYLTHGKLRKIFKQEVGNKTPSEEELKMMLPNITLSKGNVGHGFTLRGEMNAYSSHAKLAPQKALPALFTEVVGQVCYQIVCGDFPEQKVAVLNGFDLRKVGLGIPGSKAEKRIEYLYDALNNPFISTTIKSKPTIKVAALMAGVTRR